MRFSALLPLALIAALAPTVAAQDPAADVIDAYVAAFNAGDYEAMYDLVAPNAVFFVMELESARADLVGRAAFREQMERQRPQLTALGARLEVLERIVSDVTVIQRTRLTLTPATADPISITRVMMYRVANGRILRAWQLPQEEMIPAHVPTISDPAFRSGAGPVVWVDAGHNAMHTAEGTYWAFGELLRRDGFRVRTWDRSFADTVPPAGDVLVISNALADRNVGDWSLPTPSAFTSTEIERLMAWVRTGGRLLLIADHMPFPGAAADLGAAFGFTFRNGFAIDTAGQGLEDYGPWRGNSVLVFRRTDGTLGDHPIVGGRGDPNAVDSVATFTGQAFKSPDGAAPLLILSATTISLEPDTAWSFSAATRVLDVAGWHQGAALEFGQGRLVILGEAAQFRPGNGTVLLGHNGRFARRAVEWLAGVLGGSTVRR